MALRDNMISYWDMGEASGTRVNAHGSNDLTEVNTVGTAEGGADFDGGGHLACASNSELICNDATFCFAVLARLTLTGATRAILGKGWNGAGEYALGWGNAANKITGTLFDGTSYDEVASDDTFGADSTWHLVYIEYNATTNMLGVAID